VITDKVITASERNTERADAPDSTLEKEITVGKAASAYSAVEEIRLAFCEKISPEDRIGLFSDAWSTSTEIHHEA
jgi:hypothetical protein